MPMPPRLRHKWSKKTRPSSILSIRTCIKCSLVEHSNHDWTAGPKGTHWITWFEERNPELRLTVMPQCIEESRDDSTSAVPDVRSNHQPDRVPGAGEE